MKRFTAIILYLVLLGCSDGRNSFFELLPVQKASYNLEGQQFVSDERIDLSGTSLEVSLRKLGIQDAKGIVRFVISEMDSSKIRPYELVLLENKAGDNIEWILASVKKTDNSIIDYYRFRQDSMQLDAIFSHSSEISHDGIAVRFNEDRSEKGIPNIIGHSVEVFETGEIKYLSSYSNDSENFVRLPATYDYTGVYQYEGDSLSIKLDLRNGIKKGLYSYKLKITTPEWCHLEYTHLEASLVEGTIEVNPEHSLELFFDSDEVIVKSSEYESNCDEVLELDYKLIKN